MPGREQLYDDKTPGTVHERAWGDLAGDWSTLVVTSRRDVGALYDEISPEVALSGLLGVSRPPASPF